MFVLAKSIRRHLNMFQDLSILAPASRMFVEQIYQTDIENKSIDLQTRNASIYLPNNLTFHQSYLLGVQVNLLRRNNNNNNHIHSSLGNTFTISTRRWSC
jgi:hypothetical protein